MNELTLQKAAYGKQCILGNGEPSDNVVEAQNEINGNLLKIITVDDSQCVNARELHASLEVGRDFSNWIKDRIEKYGFIEGKDFSPNLAKSTGGKTGNRLLFVSFNG